MICSSAQQNTLQMLIEWTTEPRDHGQTDGRTSRSRKRRAAGDQQTHSFHHTAGPLRSQEKPTRHRDFALILVFKRCIKILFILITEVWGTSLNSVSNSLSSHQSRPCRSWQVLHGQFPQRGGIKSQGWEAPDLLRDPLLRGLPHTCHCCRSVRGEADRLPVWVWGGGRRSCTWEPFAHQMQGGWFLSKPGAGPVAVQLSSFPVDWCSRRTQSSPGGHSPQGYHPTTFWKTAPPTQTPWIPDSPSCSPILAQGTDIHGAPTYAK